VLKYVGGIMKSDNIAIINKCLEYGALDRIGNMLNNQNTAIVKNALWAFSNFVAAESS